MPHVSREGDKLPAAVIIEPFSDLPRARAVESLRDAGVFAAPRFLDAETCDRVRRGMDEGVAESAEVLDHGIDEDVRRAASIEVGAHVLEEVERRLDAIGREIAAHFGFPLGGREGAGFLRYGDGGFYRPHRDRGDSPDWPGAALRRVAAVVFLDSSRAVDSDGGFEGGALRLFVDGEPLDVHPLRGMLVAFPADVLHEVRSVSRGVRDTVVDWYY